MVHVAGNNNGPTGSPTLEQELRSSDSIVLNLAPLYSEHSQPPSLMSTFKGTPLPSPAPVTTPLTTSTSTELIGKSTQPLLVMLMVKVYVI